MADSKKEEVICVVGLGYVGLPLAIGLSQHYKVIGFDISRRRIEQLCKGVDWANEHSADELRSAKIEYTSDDSKIKEASFIIVAVPTPVTKANVPDLSPVTSAAQTIGKNISKGAVVVLESTVYPGVTEDVMAPIIEKTSGLVCGRDFFVGYSPERINPGDKEHTLERVIKVVSGMDAQTLDRVSEVYAKPCKAGVFRAASIKVAEASKVIENVQRDLNIALMNELSIVFHKMGIRTRDVLDASGTKWNFLKFFPGLVGGHCIGVDPYYLTYRSQELGYHPDIILAGRKLNDDMSRHVVHRVVHNLNLLGKTTSRARILILGLTFKENVKDCRNSKVADVISEFRRYGAEVLAWDPKLVDESELVKHEFDISLTPLDRVGKVDAVVLAVPHDELKVLGLREIRNLMGDSPFLFDLKNVHSVSEAKKLGISVEGL